MMPTIILNTFSLILFANFAAKTHPITVPIDPIMDGFIGKFEVNACPIAPEPAVNAIIKFDVPIPMCNGYCIIKTKINNIITPPPAPNTPHKTPIIKPNIKPDSITFALRNFNKKLFLYSFLFFSTKFLSYLIFFIPL